MATPWVADVPATKAIQGSVTNMDITDDQVTEAKQLAEFICGSGAGTAVLLAGPWATTADAGSAAAESSPAQALRAQTLLTGDLLVIDDATSDPRLTDLAGLTGMPDVRFFAGVPLIAENGNRLGVLAVQDSSPRTLDHRQRECLRALGHQVRRALEARQSAETLRVREEQQTAVAQLGVTALTGLPLPLLLDQATSLVCEVLGVDLCAVLEAEPGGATLRFAAGTGWDPGTVGSAVLPAIDSYAGAVYSTGQPLIVSDFSAEPRFPPPALLRQHGAVSGVAVVTQGHTGPAGVLIAHTRNRRDFTYDDVVFLQLVANTLAGAVVRSETEQQVRHQAMHDALTGLPNRALLLDRLQQHMARSRRTGHEIAALFIDLDDFKPVNDTLGHEAGDELLVAFADRLRSLTRPSDTISRLAGDEFVLILEEPEGAPVARRVADRIAAKLTEPFRLRAGQVSVSASIGIAMGSSATDPDTLLRNADAAMYQAKRSGAGRCAVFDESLHTRHLRHLQLKQQLRGAIERGEMTVVYQPVVEVGSGVLQAVEALLRWEHPEFGTVAPAEFIPLAEDSGLIVPIGRWVLSQALAGAARWNGEGRPPVIVHVNLSRRQLADPGLVAATADAFRRTGADPAHIGFEITESALLDDTEAALASLQALKDLGVQLAMDDFGTGYSSLAYLKRMPVDLVKIDRSFIDGLGSNAGDSAIVAAVVRMADALGLTVTAEGVESSGQLAQLRSLGCALAQGFYFAYPLPQPEIDALLPTHQGEQLVVPERDRLPAMISGAQAVTTVP